MTLVYAIYPLGIVEENVYNTRMAKRATGLTSKIKKSPHKTKKRLEIKRAMLAERAAKKRGKK